MPGVSALITVKNTLFYDIAKFRVCLAMRLPFPVWSLQVILKSKTREPDNLAIINNLNLFIPIRTQ